MIRALIASAFCLAAGLAFAHPAMTADDTIMRVAPSRHARVVQRIPAHAQIDVADCGEDWCAASWRDLDGFVRVQAIGLNEAPLYHPRRYYGGPVFGFGYYHNW